MTTHHNVSGEDNASRLAWTSNLAEKPAGIDRAVGADTVYFVGCVSAMFPIPHDRICSSAFRRPSADRETLETSWPSSAS